MSGDINWANLANPHQVYHDPQSGGTVDVREALAHRKGVDPSSLPSAQYAERGVRKDGQEYTKTKRRDKITLEVRRAQISALYAQDDMSLQKIADRLTELTGETWTKMNVYHHVNRLINFWREKSLAHIDEKKAFLMARLGQCEDLAMDCFFSSLEGRKITQKEFQRELKARYRKLDADRAIKEAFGDDRTGPATEEEEVAVLMPVMEKSKGYTRKEKGAGNASRGWLELVVKIQEVRAKIWAVYSSVAEDPERDLAKLTDEERDERITAILGRAAQKRQEVQSQQMNPALVPAPAMIEVEFDMAQQEEWIEPIAETEGWD